MATQTAVETQPVVPSTRKTFFYRPELHILRFSAFLAIYVSHCLSHDPADYARHHMSQRLATFGATVASAGQFGFQLLFVLTGYLVTAVLLRERWTRGDIDLKAFYARRALRIGPLYFLVLLLAAVWPMLGRLPSSYLLAFVLGCGNWMTSLFGPPASWASVLWSISLVMQFLLIWPLVIKYFSRNGRLYATLGLLVAANLTRLYLSVGTLHPYSVFPNTLAQLDALGAGALCAIVLKAAAPAMANGKRLLLLYSGIVLLLACGLFDRTETSLFVLAGYPVVVAGCVAVLLGTCGTSLQWKPLVYLGKISFGLYVLHLLALRFVGSFVLKGKAGSTPRVLIFWFGSFLLTLALASFSYHLLEKPFLRRKNALEFIKTAEA